MSTNNCTTAYSYLLDIVPCFEGNFADALLDKAFRERATLRDFVFNLHEKKIVDFRELDSKIINLNRQRLVTQLHQNRPRRFDGASEESEIGILQNQFGLTIRKAAY